MSNQEILHYNKLCAEFLNYEFDEFTETYETSFLKVVDNTAFGDEMYSCKLLVSELEFHSDWNWIMELVNAIENLKEGVFQVDILQEGCKINKQNRLLIDCTINKLPINTTKKESVVKALYNFLIWYNENYT